MRSFGRLCEIASSILFVFRFIRWIAPELHPARKRTVVSVASRAWLVVELSESLAMRSRCARISISRVLLPFSDSLLARYFSTEWVIFWAISGNNLDGSSLLNWIKSAPALVAFRITSLLSRAVRRTKGMSGTRDLTFLINDIPSISSMR
ncbi:MAG: hypothetical protein BWY45_01120 [Euryarchaeota archaeon ADurb.Bin294]|nr:MAG: hypothetical protein BWY45_01120 [Euryarchaeota archaeon ADurb.Bin294]